MDVGPAVDLAVVQRLRNWFGPDRTGQLATLFDSFNAEADLVIAAMEKEAECDDRPAVERLAHRLFGSSGTMGAQSVAALCAGIESGREFDTADLTATLSRLAEERRRFSAELEILLARPLAHG
jgi:HPt (histidine-containing phosphotransfer) domain-containing protein